MKTITMSGIGMRFLFAFFLICFTWNPTPYSYYDWALKQWKGELAPLVAFVGIALVIGWAFYLRSTARALGAVGIILSVALAATVLWALVKYVVDTSHTVLLQWIVLVLLAAILAAGMSWSHLRRAWAGQADVDDVDNR
jgi:cobalamin biosynthesis protein CobD/CbiB